MIIDKLANFFANTLVRHKPIAEIFKNISYCELPMLSIDLELTDLNTKLAKVTSIGWLQGRGFEIDLSSTYYQIVRASGDLNQSPVIHGLIAKDMAGGQHIREQLFQLHQYAGSHVWVFHNAALDVAVLNRLWALLELDQVTITTIDTMLLEVYAMEKKHGFVPNGEVTLGQSRAHYELATVSAHNALDDALATITLLFAQLYALDKTSSISLTELSHTQAVRAYTLG
ncbi:MAG: DNA polymerase-3 subunit epsilon [Alphaproteobacteria bacterium]|jgi:DNA polymerase-3 subunit epsilon